MKEKDRKREREIFNKILKKFNECLYTPKLIKFINFRVKASKQNKKVTLLMIKLLSNKSSIIVCDDIDE
jgi:hypothetical protein